MKKILLVILAISFFNNATPNTREGFQQKTMVQGYAKEDSTKKDKRYLAGAIPLVDGKVVFTMDEDIHNKNAQEIYDLLYTFIDNMTQEDNQTDKSQITLFNKQEHIIVARFREWMIFKKQPFNLDQTIFNYTMIVKCSDQHVNITISHISYEYELERNDGEGMITSAEEWITDEFALTKKKDRLSKYSGKFRRKTIDRKNEIFSHISKTLSH